MRRRILVVVPAAAWLWACGGVAAPADAGGDCGDAGAIPAELGGVAAEVLHDGTLVNFGLRWGGGGCVVSPPAMSLRFQGVQPGTYTAPPRGCPAPDGGTAALCGSDLEALLGESQGTGTLKIFEASGSLWGGFEGEVDLAFATDAGARSYAFSFVAPVCGIE